MGNINLIKVGIGNFSVVAVFVYVLKFVVIFVVLVEISRGIVFVLVVKLLFIEIFIW